MIYLISKVVFFSLFYFLEIFEIVFWILMYPFWKSMLYILLFKESLYILLISNLMWAFVNTLGLWTFQNEIQMKISNENICSLLVYVPKLSWSFSKFMFLSIIIEIRIPTIRKASFIEFFTLVLLFTRIVQFQLIPIGSCWHHLQVIYPISCFTMYSVCVFAIFFSFPLRLINNMLNKLVHKRQGDKNRNIMSLCLTLWFLVFN